MYQQLRDAEAAPEAELRSLPAEVGQLQSLTSLDVSGNELKALPEELGLLGSLRSLKAYKNQLTALPEKLGELASLREVNLFNNKVLKCQPKLGLHIHSPILVATNTLEQHMIWVV